MEYTTGALLIIFCLLAAGVIYLLKKIDDKIDAIQVTIDTILEKVDGTENANAEDLGSILKKIDEALAPKNGAIQVKEQSNP